MNFPDKKLLSPISAAPLDQASWQAFASLLRDRFQLVSCSIHFKGPGEKLQFLNCFDAPEVVRTFHQQHENEYHSLNPFHFAAMKNGWVYRWDDFIDREDLLQSTFYTELCCPMGFEYAMCMSVEEPSGLRLWLCVVRSSSPGDFTEGERVKFQRLFAPLRHCLKKMSVRV